MQSIFVNNKEYFTNIVNPERLQKCKDFFKDGCVSYVVSFDNKEHDKMFKVKVKGIDIFHLRGINFDQYFIPKIAKNIKTSEKMLTNGLDLIEIL